jgi:hypothetical protein
MTALERLMLKFAAAALLVLGAWLWHAGKVGDAYKAGQAAAVAAGNARHAADIVAARKTEADLRLLLSTKDELSRNKEILYAENLSAAQRRLVSGADRLRCPGAGTVSNAAATAAGPAAGGAAPDGPGAAIVPEVASDILGLAADTGRVLRKYQRVVERLDACIALNNRAEPAQE